MIKTYRFITVCLLLLSAVLFINLHSDIYVPVNKPFVEFPTNHKGWRMVSESAFSERVLNVLKPTDYMFRQYVSDSGIPVYLYIGYHGGGKDSGEIHSPKHCLPGGGWFKSLEEEIVFDAGNKKINVVKACYSMREEKDIFFYFFQVKERSLTNEYLLKAYEIINSILYRRRDAAFIRISVPVTTDEESASQAGIIFLRDFYPIIEDFLPK